MKRVKSACLYQTLQFSPKDPMSYDETLQAMTQEVEHYEHSLKKTRRKYTILRRETLKEGSIVIEVKKEVSGYDAGSYL